MEFICQTKIGFTLVAILIISRQFEWKPPL